MRRFILFTILLSSWIFARADISSGSEGGTYIQIAREIAQTVGKDIGLNMRVVQSTGSKANIKNMIEDPNIKFAIVQHDIMQFLKRSKKEKYHKLIEDVRVLVPLYIEEVHIIVKKDSSIRSIQDIRGKKVAIGSKGSGTALTALLIYERAFGKGSLTRDMIDRSPLPEALNRLDRGEVDVVFAVGAQPITALNRDREYRLIPINSPKILSNYYETNITKDSYPWLERNIPTAGVLSFLICNRASALSPSKMREFGRDFARRLNYLKRFGHKRWQEVKRRLPPLPSTQNWRYCKEFKRGWDDSKRRDGIISTPPPPCPPEERALGLCRDRGY